MVCLIVPMFFTVILQVQLQDTEILMEELLVGLTILLYLSQRPVYHLNTQGVDVGGITGYNYGGKVINCYCEGRVTGYSSDNGGLVG